MQVEAQFYPNPFQVDFYVESEDLKGFKLYNERGDLVLDEELRSMDYLHHFHWPYLKQGLYFLVLEKSDGSRKRLKIMKRPW